MRGHVDVKAGAHPDLRPEVVLLQRGPKQLRLGRSLHLGPDNLVTQEALLGLNVNGETLIIVMDKFDLILVKLSCVFLMFAYRKKSIDLQLQ